MSIVLDTSAILAFFFEEEKSNKVKKLLEKSADGEFEIIAPELMDYEVGNAFVKVARGQRKKSKHLTKKLRSSIQRYADLGILIKKYSVEPFMEDIFTIAVKYKLSFYDASYVVLGEKTRSKFITADEKLYNSVRKDFNFVELL